MHGAFFSGRVQVLLLHCEGIDAHARTFPLECSLSVAQINRKKPKNNITCNLCPQKSLLTIILNSLVISLGISLGIGLGLAACVSGETPRATPFPSASLSPLPTTSVSVTPTIVISPTLTPLPPSPFPSATPTITPLACLQEAGRKEQGSLSSQLLRLPLEYSVYLPPCYDQQADSRYPVLYLIHGQNYNNDQWDRLGADEAADTLIASGDVSPFIIVLPRDRSWAQPSEDNFGQVLTDQLVPYIDAHYRTRAERAYRAVGGLSRGAGWAVHLGLSRWELFGAIGAHSLPVFWSDTSHIRQWLKAIPIDEMPRIYLDIGEKDRPSILASAVWFENLLTEQSIPHEWHLFPGYHEEAYWQAHVEAYLRWYAAGWKVGGS